MAGQKFQYDESGSTFLYFLISFLGLVLVPCTFYFGPAEVVPVDEKKKNQCLCEECVAKEERLKTPEKWKDRKKTIQRIILLLGWCFMAFLVYKVQEFDYEYANFDPYDILGVGATSSMSEIKKAFKKQSLVLHPDKPTGDERKFMKLYKAYQALTDETARKNYELYGNPDGPGAMNFGIALPSWIVEKENTIWVLGLYGLVFMIGLPTVVAIWWYRSSKFSNDQVLIDTTQLYYYYFHKSPLMIFKRVLMVLAASLEFEKGHNPQIKERPSDNVEIPHLMRMLPNLGEKNKERPLCFPYSVKARALLHAHLKRIKLNADTIDKDRLYIVDYCPALINEMVSCLAQLIMLAHAGRISRLPSLDTIEATLRLCPHIVQAIGEGKSPLLQLPHVSDDCVRNLSNRRKPIRTVQHYVALPPEERRQILQNITDDQYTNIMKVCQSFPLITMNVISEVVDDDDTGVFTAGAIVTVTVNLTRRSLAEIMCDKEREIKVSKKPTSERKKTESGWKRPQPKKVKPSNHKPKNSLQGVKKRPPKPKTANKQPQATANTKPVAATTTVARKSKKPNKSDSQDLDNVSDDDSNSGSHSDESEAEEADTESHRETVDEDAEWEKFQKGLTKREKVLEGMSKVSHIVHCPYFTSEKYEYWWAYVCDKKKRMLVTAPFQITNLVDEEEVQLKFTAPHKPGRYTFQVCLRSDSYLGFDKIEEIKLDVKEAREIPTGHPQWEEFSSEEEDDDDEQMEDDGESEFTTDDEVTEDSD